MNPSLREDRQTDKQTNSHYINIDAYNPITSSVKMTMQSENVKRFDIHSTYSSGLCFELILKYAVTIVDSHTFFPSALICSCAEYDSLIVNKLKTGIEVYSEFHTN